MQVGLIPTPATISNYDFGFTKQLQFRCTNNLVNRKSKFANLFRTRSSIAEQPVVCGKDEGANPFGSAIYINLRNVAQFAEHPAWDREVAGVNPAIPTIYRCCGRMRRGVRLLNERMRVQILPAAPFPLPGSVKVARRSVTPLELVRVQSWQPFQ